MGTCPDAIKRLIDRFQQHSDRIRSPDYNETLIRIDFINPLMSELGWDIDNRQGFAEQYREVVHEDRVKVAGQTKAPDYSFRIGGVRKFFLEAKKPAVDIKNNWEPAYQLRRYAWSAKLACSLLTDFEEFAIYDARLQPKQLEKASVARREYIHYADYPARWDFLSGTFSKDAVLKGEFDRYCESKKGRGAQAFDDAFLGEIEEWRKAIATGLARSNPGLDEPALNFAVQRIIDRVIFLRIAEDRGTEPVGQLQALLNGDNVYPRLVTLFNRADERYNSGLFHFAKEKDRDEAPDTLTPTLDVDDRTLKGIIKALYYPQSPYEFTMVSADILGSVYERFLGKVITLTAGHNARIEEKPEVRKAGGVYYTPTYIVDYIVKNTVGKLLDGKSPREAAKLKVLDPACGSGSFLIGAYQFLLDWYHAQYAAADPAALAAGKNPVLRPGPAGGWALTIAERKRILLDHLHGVDLDGQAVEVTKLNLLLKCLEGETSQTLGFEQRLFRERALPDLGKNIKCGNSLIGSDIVITEAWGKMSDTERDQIKPFDYIHGFPTIFNGKGTAFDVVIGNPPYRREKDYKPLLDLVALGNFGKEHKSARMDLWYYFVHRALELVRPGGLISFITNSYWTSGTGAEKLIMALSKNRIEEIFSLGKLRVFEGVSGQHMIFRVARDFPGTTNIIECVSSDSDDAQAHVGSKDKVAQRSLPQSTVVRNGKVECSLSLASIDLDSTFEHVPRLRELGIIRQGIAENPSTINKKTNERFGNAWRAGEGVFTLTPSEVARLSIPANEAVLLRPYHDLSDLGRYRIASNPSRVIIYSTKTTCPNISEFPVLGAHLARFRRIMEERRETENGSNSWWHLHWPRDESLWISSKILSIQMAARPNFVISEIPTYVPFSVNVMVPTDSRAHAIRFLLGLLNSRVLWAWFMKRAKRRGIGLEINGGVLADAPAAKFDEANHLHSRIVSFVDAILSHHKRLAAEQLPQRREQIQREIDATDRQIDQLVYRLYGLTDDEIRIVEDATK